MAILRRPSDSGHSLLELLTVLTLIGILAALASPSFEGVLAVQRARHAVDRLAGDVYLARMHAIRTAGRVEIRFEWDTARRCVTRYALHELDGDRLLLKRVDLRSELPDVCLTMTNARKPLTFGWRGLPFGVMARTFVARSGTVADTLVLSQLGRLLREY